ncbi:Condensin complex subunit [Echinococcus granulosus]|uniref:Condensin complex subunit 1 n=1 Tax=Echinococcus granulosus TaxID=6210 RepID=W6VE21_ECHGR|nr:Condensin complex subunit [Echinococcus granulosus]EUB65054.1 Condensin complex subunit [Echinococcus granulosus]
MISYQACQKYLVREGHGAVLKCFDALFSVLHEWKSVDSGTKEDTWHIVLKGCEVSVRELVGVIKPPGSTSGLNRNDLLERRNAVKMHAYLLCQLIEIIENDSTAESSASSSVKVGRGRSKALNSAAKVRRPEFDMSLNWPDECSTAITVLDQLCKLDIKQFWDPPVVEDDFVNLLANSCYKLLENKSLSASAMLRMAITNLLSTLIQFYKHGIACCLKLAQMLQCFAHTANVLSAIVNNFMTDETMVPFVKELLTEICSYNGEDLERDSTGTHNLCSFLELVSSAHPSLATSILPLIRTRLSEDPYQMRNCALNVIGEVLRNLHADHAQIEGKDKIQRDRLMDVLQEHIHDVNGFVRARALQIWCNLASAGGLPIRRQVQLASLLVGSEGAVFDVSSLVRKYAMRLLTVIIIQCPAAKLSMEDLARVLNKEQMRLQVLEENFGRFNQEDTAVLPSNPANTDDAKKCLSEDHEGEGGKEEEKGEESDGEEESRRAESEAEEEEDVVAEQGVSEAAAALEAVIHSAAQVAQEGQMNATPSHPPPISAEVAFEAQKADLVRQRACVAYLHEMQRFAVYVSTGIEDVCNLLHSKNVTDVLEAIEFFLTAKQAGVRNLDAALRHMMAMVWSQEEQIRKAVLDASRRLYFQPDIVNESFTVEGRLSSAALAAVISTLVRLVSESTMGDFVSLERILRELLDLGHVDEDLRRELWSRFTDLAAAMTDTAAFRSERRQELKALLILLKMISSPSRKNLELHLNDLVNYGLGAATGYANIDLECAMYACMAIQQMIPTDKIGKQKSHSTRSTPVNPKSHEPFRLPVSDPLCTSLRRLLISTFASSSRLHWIPLMEQAVATIFQLIDTPSLVMAEVIREIGEQLLRTLMKPPSFTQPQKEAQEPSQLDDEGEENSQAQGDVDAANDTAEPTSQTVPPTIPSFILARFIALAGHVALKMLVHLEFSILNELKRREVIQEESKQAKKHFVKTPRSARLNANPNASTRLDTTTNGTQKGDTSGGAGNSALEEEAALLGAVADDAEADYIRNVLNNEIVLEPDHLLSRLLPLVVHVCSHPSRYVDPDLQASASLSLAKFMLVSSAVCEQNLQLLFTLAERSPSDVVRANLIVGLGDLARRFPNLIEPWTPNLYARLRDTSPKVRINALNTLSHLILNDMVKVKGQISEMTVCLVDENDRLRQLSRLFFRELAQKGNALYNVIPDIISRLSDPEVGVNETKFRTTVDFLFPLIEKERLCETLVEKICSRFRVTQTERQWRDLAYCLRVMSFNERMIRTLQENLPIFAQQLSIPDVYQSFSEILANVKKNAKTDALPHLEEFEAKIEEFHRKGVADEEALQRAEVMVKKAVAKRRRIAAPDARKSVRRVNQMGSGDIDSGEAEKAEEMVAVRPPSPRRTRTRRTAATSRSYMIFSSDEEEALQTVPVKSTLRAAPEGGKAHIRPKTGAGVVCGGHLEQPQTVVATTWVMPTTPSTCVDVYMSQLPPLGKTSFQPHETSAESEQCVSEEARKEDYLIALCPYKNTMR